MNFNSSLTTWTLTIFEKKITHIFNNMGIGEIEHLIIDAKFKEAIWRV